ncbi:hypothetical protein X997_5520 [Burkholderia pseudomallei A79C]|nr:hypothetical protein X997_5520 [Burkholderia pseudomallei A79C]
MPSSRGCLFQSEILRTECVDLPPSGQMMCASDVRRYTRQVRIGLELDAPLGRGRG